MLTQLFKSLVLPRLEYGSQLWSSATVNQIRAMESMQRKFTKYIDSLSSLSYRERLIGLHMYSLQQRREICSPGGSSHLCVENTGRYDSQSITTNSRESIKKKKSCVCAEGG